MQAYLVDLVRKSLAPRLKIGEQTYAVEILSRDTQSDPSRRQLAKDLINSDKIDMMLAARRPRPSIRSPTPAKRRRALRLDTVPWEAWYFGRGAKPGRAVAVQMDLPFRLSASTNSSRPTSRSGS